MCLVGVDPLPLIDYNTKDNRTAPDARHHRHRLHPRPDAHPGAQRVQQRHALLGVGCDQRQRPAPAGPVQQQRHRVPLLLPLLGGCQRMGCHPPGGRLRRRRTDLLGTLLPPLPERRGDPAHRRLTPAGHLDGCPLHRLQYQRQPHRTRCSPPSSAPPFAPP